MLSKKIIIILLCIIFSCIVLVGLFSSNSTKRISYQEADVKTAIAPVESLIISFQAEPTVVMIGKTSRVDIRVAPQGTPLTVATVELQYNPTLVEVIQMDQGNLWGQQSQLENNIDNKKGVARITLGQGFDALATGDNLVASYIFKAKAIGTVPLSLGSKTIFARVGHKGPLPVYAEPYAITVQ